MIKTGVTLTGWIADAHVIEPEKSWMDTQSKYKLVLHPEDYGVFDDIEARIFDLKQSTPVELNPNVEEHYENKDHLFDGATVLLETIRKPTLLGDINRTSQDMEFIGKYVRVLGNLKLHKDGNAYITFHLIEEMSKDLDLDDIDVDPDDIW